MKTGIRTTEFWLILAAMCVAAVFEVVRAESPEPHSTALVILAAVYAVSRTLLKVLKGGEPYGEVDAGGEAADGAKGDGGGLQTAGEGCRYGGPSVRPEGPQEGL